MWGMDFVVIVEMVPGDGGDVHRSEICRINGYDGLCRSRVIHGVCEDGRSYVNFRDAVENSVVGEGWCCIHVYGSM